MRGSFVFLTVRDKSDSDINMIICTGHVSIVWEC